MVDVCAWWRGACYGGIALGNVLPGWGGYWVRRKRDGAKSDVEHPLPGSCLACNDLGMTRFDGHPR
jgi:hypothetical protein